MLHKKLVASINAHDATACVVGLGYVGLPLAVSVAKNGFRVVGIDINQPRVDAINSGEAGSGDAEREDLRKAVKAGRLRAVTSFAAAASASVISISVPTPVDHHKNPDMTFIVNAVEGLLPHLRKGQLLILESTTYPGTTEEIILPRLRERGFVIGTDFFVAFSPERIDPGNARFHLTQIPKVVGGVTAACSEAARTFYEAGLGVKVVTVSSPAAAEMTKLLENIFRIVNVSLVNELAMLCDRMGIDIWEVIEAAKTKPFGFMPFFPGPGMGGHCIPVDAFYLAWKAKEHGFTTRFIELAGQVNDSMPDYVVDRCAEALNSHGKALRGSTVLLVGVSYKANVGDLRESPALRIADLLVQRGADIQYHDPHVPNAYIGGSERRSVPLEPARVGRADLVVVLTNHAAIDFAKLTQSANLVFDTRNSFGPASHTNIFRLGTGPFVAKPPAATANTTKVVQKRGK